MCVGGCVCVWGVCVCGGVGVCVYGVCVCVCGAQTELASYRVDWQASVRACLTDRNFLTSGMTLISGSSCTVDRKIKHCSGRWKNAVARNQEGRDCVLFGIFRLP